MNGVIDCRRQSSDICKFMGGGPSFPCKIDFGIPSNRQRDSFFSRCERERGGMRPKERREAGEQDLFRARLDQIIAWIMRW
jgi:hypothetical protein